MTTMMHNIVALRRCRRIIVDNCALNEEDLQVFARRKVAHSLCGRYEDKDGLDDGVLQQSEPVL